MVGQGSVRWGLRCFALLFLLEQKGKQEEGTTNAIAVKKSVKKQSQARHEAELCLRQWLVCCPFGEPRGLGATAVAV